MKELDIANIAEIILNEDKKKIQNGEMSRPNTEGADQVNSGPDYSKVNVSESDVAALLGKETITEKKVVKQPVTNDRASKVLENLTKALREAKQLVAEMTTCGTIGVNMGPAPKDPKKPKKSKGKQKIKDLLNAKRSPY